jgi:hypothetical protein
MIFGDVGIDYFRFAFKEMIFYIFRRLMGTPLRSESVTVVLKVGFEDRLDYYLLRQWSFGRRVIAQQGDSFSSGAAEASARNVKPCVEAATNEAASVWRNWRRLRCERLMIQRGLFLPAQASYRIFNVASAPRPGRKARKYRRCLSRRGGGARPYRDGPRYVSAVETAPSATG